MGKTIKVGDIVYRPGIGNSLWKWQVVAIQAKPFTFGWYGRQYMIKEVGESDDMCLLEREKNLYTIPSNKKQKDK